MKPTVALCASLMALPAMAQRDFQLITQRNAWLTSGNAAALTTLTDSTVSQGAISYSHTGGALRTVSQPQRENAVGADVQSYYRISPTIVANGKIAYTNRQGTQMSGSMLLPTSELMPFDLVDDSLNNAGDKRTELFNLVGAIGWQAWRHVAVGAKVDFTAGTYAKHRDLRHTNTIMQLRTGVNTFWSPNGTTDGIGAGFLYYRTTETMLFDVYGTTDRVFKTLVDYANHHGEVETYGVEGFTDNSREVPLLSQYVGFNVQGAWKRLFADASYMHRSGYYGKLSQYTASHEQHRGDIFTLHLRGDVAKAEKHHWWIDGTLNTERLTANRENYRRVAASDNNSVTYYEYYEQTKMSDKAQTYGTVSATGYWHPSGEIYLWHVHAGVDYWTRKQTAYLYPETFTEQLNVITPFAEARRSFLLHDTSLLSAELGSSMATGDIHLFAAHAALRYEFPIRHTAVRPSISARYDFRTATSDCQQGLTRNVITATAGVTF